MKWFVEDIALSHKHATTFVRVNISFYLHHRQKNKIGRVSNKFKIVSNIHNINNTKSNSSGHLTVANVAA